MLGAGILLFVSAQWDFLSPAARFALTLLLVAIFHVAAALVVERFPAMSTALHAIGTIALGAGIFLAGQIFNLDEHWPGGLMLWALGAAAAWWILRSLPQFVLLATLAPAWLAAEWMAAADNRLSEVRQTVPDAAGLVIATDQAMARAYAKIGRAAAPALMWIGAFTILQAAGALAASSSYYPQAGSMRSMEPLLRSVGWIAAIGLPLRSDSPRAEWVVAADVCRGVGAVLSPWAVTPESSRSIPGGRSVRSVLSRGAFAMRAASGSISAPRFLLSPSACSFSRVMDNLGRSASRSASGY